MRVDVVIMDSAMGVGTDLFFLSNNARYCGLIVTFFFFKKKAYLLPKQPSGHVA